MGGPAARGLAFTLRFRQQGFIDPNFIIEVAQNTESAYEQAKHEADTSKHLDHNVPFGEAPRVVETSERDLDRADASDRPGSRGKDERNVREEGGRQKSQEAVGPAAPSPVQATIRNLRTVRAAQTPVSKTSLRRALAAQFPGLDRGSLPTFANQVITGPEGPTTEVAFRRAGTIPRD